MNEKVKAGLMQALEFLTMLPRDKSQCYGVVFKFSNIERYFQESGYRRSVAMALQPLIRQHGAKTFGVGEGDTLMVTKTVGEGPLMRALKEVLSALKDSKKLGGLTPVLGQDDAFFSWFPLGQKEAELKDYLKVKLDHLDEGAGAGTDFGGAVTGVAVAPRPRVELPSIETPKSAAKEQLTRRAATTDQFVALMGSVKSLDMSGLVARKKVEALTPGAPAATVMVHRYVPLQRVLDRLLGTGYRIADPTWRACLQRLVSVRLLASSPDMGGDQSLASSLRLSLDSIFDSSFEAFDRQFGEGPRRRIVLEFSLTDMLTAPDKFDKAVQVVRKKGYRIQVGDIESGSVPWLKPEMMGVDFIKVRASARAYENWLSPSRGPAVHMRAMLKTYGPQRVILDECDNESYRTAAQKLGAVLFTGEEE